VLHGNDDDDSDQMAVMMMKIIQCIRVLIHVHE